MNTPNLEGAAREYINRQRRQFTIKEQLGAGTDGSVWATTNNSAVKAVEREKNYTIELRCYQRLMEHGVKDIDGLTVPQLLGFSATLRVIEMTLVHPPFLLDFGKAYLDEPSPYTQEQLAEWRRSWHQFFPKGDIQRVNKVLRLLRGHGIEYVDPKPWNIRFHKEQIEGDEDWDYE